MGLLTKIKHKLSEVLAFDNKTDGNDILVSDGDSVDFLEADGKIMNFASGMFFSLAQGGKEFRFRTTDNQFDNDTGGAWLAMRADGHPVDESFNFGAGKTYMQISPAKPLSPGGGRYNFFGTDKDGTGQTGYSIGSGLNVNSANENMCCAFFGVRNGGGDFFNNHNSVAIGGTGTTVNKSNYAFAQNLEVQGGIINHTKTSGTLRTFANNVSESLQPLGTDSWVIQNAVAQDFSKSWFYMRDNSAQFGNTLNDYMEVTSVWTLIQRDGKSSISIFKRTTGGTNLAGDTTPVILSSNNSTIPANTVNSVILGGTGITANKNEYAFAKNIEVQGGIAQYDAVRTLTLDTEFAHKKYVDDAVGTIASSYIQTGQTANVTPLVLTTTNPSKPITEDSVLSFITRVTGVSSTGDVWVYEFRGSVKNITGTSTIAGTITEESITEEVAMDGVAVNIAPDNATDVLEIEVTGLAATTINWKAETVFSEVTF